MKLNISNVATDEKAIQATSPSAASSSVNLPALPPMTALDHEQSIFDMIKVRDPQHLEETKRAAAVFDMWDTNEIMAFAGDEQESFTAAVTAMFGNAKIKDIGDVGQIVLRLKYGVDLAAIDKLRSELARGLDTAGGFFKGLFSAVKAFIKNQKELEDVMNEVAEAAREKANIAATEIADGDVKYQLQENNTYVLGLYLLTAAEIIRIWSGKYSELLEEAQTGDATKGMQVRRLNQNLVCFNGKMAGIMRAYTRGPRQMQQILSLQMAAKQEAVNQMNILHEVLPDFAMNLLNIIGAINLQVAQKERGMVQDLATQISNQAGDLIEQVGVNAAQAMNDWDAQLEQMQKEQQRCLDATAKIAEINKEGLERTKQADQVMAGMLQEFKDANLKALALTQPEK